MRLISLNVGATAVHRYDDGREIHTGGYKSPVSEAELGLTQLAGDGQADLINHGGHDKAVNVYAQDHYAYWEGVFGSPLTPGAFSENLTVLGALEDEVCIGDRWRIGAVELEVSQPRMPCYKLAYKHGKKHLVKWVQESGFTGFYLRTVTPGLLRAGVEIAISHRDPAGVSIAEINTLLYSHGAADTALAARILAVGTLSESSRWIITKRLKRPIID
jgi:MOSC domain-containing protein YiiM